MERRRLRGTFILYRTFFAFPCPESLRLREVLTSLIKSGYRSELKEPKGSADDTRHGNHDKKEAVMPASDGDAAYRRVQWAAMSVMSRMSLRLQLPGIAVPALCRFSALQDRNHE
jgi:hypothetical protein